MHGLYVLNYVSFVKSIGGSFLTNDFIHEVVLPTTGTPAHVLASDSANLVPGEALFGNKLPEVCAITAAQIKHPLFVEVLAPDISQSLMQII